MSAWMIRPEYVTLPAFSLDRLWRGCRVQRRQPLNGVVILRDNQRERLGAAIDFDTWMLVPKL